MSSDSSTFFMSLSNVESILGPTGTQTPTSLELTEYSSPLLSSKPFSSSDSIRVQWSPQITSPSSYHAHSLAQQGPLTVSNASGCNILNSNTLRIRSSKPLPLWPQPTLLGISIPNYSTSTPNFGYSNNSKFSSSDVFLTNSKELIRFFDELEELRNLTQLELFLRIKVKERAYELANNEEIKWQQRARCKWLNSSYRNTKYFHALASSKRQKMAITKLFHLGMEITDHKLIMQAFLSHFQGLMGTRQQLQWMDVGTLYDHQHDLQHLD